MGQQPADRALLQQALDAEAKYPFREHAAKSIGVNGSTFRYRIGLARKAGLTVSAGVTDTNSPEILHRQIKRLEADLKLANREKFDHAIIKDKILTLEKSVNDLEPPKWVITPKKGHDHPGVPTLMLSDLHFGETIDPSQIGGVNSFNMTIAKARLKEVGESAIRLLSILSPEFKYPGLVMALGGDLVNGNLREESTATNEENIMPVVLALYEQIGSLIEMMVEKFGKLFLPCVAGNHGRNTVKTWSSDRHATSFEWLLYCLLAKRYAHDSRITFLIPNGVDANYRVFDYRFLLNHGDAYRGGDGVIGVLGPVVRGDYKKRARNSQINMEYDTQIIGHFHQYVHLSKLIINGSLCGYNSFAYINNFPYEAACQALWLNHPKYGVTYRMPVYASKREVKGYESWVSPR